MAVSYTTPLSYSYRVTEPESLVKFENIGKIAFKNMFYEKLSDHWLIPIKPNQKINIETFRIDKAY